MLTSPMRRTRYGSGTALRACLWTALAASPTACLAPPTPREVLAAGFRTPEQTFATFRTALRGDLIDLEYRCLSPSFRLRHGIPSQLIYERAREELLRREPFLRWIATAELLGRTDLDADHVLLDAEVPGVFATRRFGVLLERGAFYETHDAQGLLEDDYVLWSEALTHEDGEIVLRAPMPEGVALEDLTEFRAGREWKIAGFDALEPD